MNGKDFLNELEHLDDDLVEKHETPKKRSTAWKKYLGVAACAVVCAGLLGVVSLTGGLGGSSSGSPEDTMGAGASDTYAGEADDGTAGEASTSSSGDGMSAVTLLAKAKEISLPEQPTEDMLYNGTTGEEEQEYWDQQEEYYNAVDELKKNSPDESYLDGLQSFSARTMQQVLSAGKKNENMVYSPANLYMALTMLTECADGNTRQQLLDLLGTDDVKEMRTQTTRLWKAMYTDSAYGKTLLANSLWINSSGYGYQEDTLDLLSDRYYASVYEAEMGSNETDEAIAGWIDDNTGDLLSDQSGKIKTDASDAARLYSTLYFYGQWQDRFSEEQTSESVFTCADGTEQMVDFMHTTDESSFIRGDGYTMAWRSFSDTYQNQSSMLFVLPDEGTDISELLANTELQQLLLDTEARQDASVFGNVEWSVPKFDVSSSESLNDSLQALGVTDVFTERADLTNLVDGTLFVSNIQQAARVKVDEKGCEAASYTEILLAGAAMIEDIQRCEMNLNRPFLFVITGEDNLPLFVGVVNQAGE